MDGDQLPVGRGAPTLTPRLLVAPPSLRPPASIRELNVFRELPRELPRDLPSELKRDGRAERARRSLVVLPAAR